jgi:hypothetical protein
MRTLIRVQTPFIRLDVMHELITRARTEYTRPLHSIASCRAVQCYAVECSALQCLQICPSLPRSSVHVSVPSVALSLFRFLFPLPLPHVGPVSNYMHGVNSGRDRHSSLQKEKPGCPIRWLLCSSDHCMML